MERRLRKVKRRMSLYMSIDKNLPVKEAVKVLKECDWNWLEFLDRMEERSGLSKEELNANM